MMCGLGGDDALLGSLTGIVWVLWVGEGYRYRQDNCEFFFSGFSVVGKCGKCGKCVRCIRGFCDELI